MQNLTGRPFAYMAFAAFCLFSSARDVLSEALFKNHSYDASPVFVVFVYSIVTQCIAGALVLVQRPVQRTKQIIEHGRRFVLLNFFTLAAFFLYFLAINSPLGAAVNSFVDYGSSPALTAIVGSMLAQERLDKVFAVSALLSVAGIVVLGAPRIYVDHFSFFWVTGLVLCLLSSISSAFYRVYYRLLLLGGETKSAIIFVRLFGLTTVLGFVLLARPELFRSDLLTETVVIGLVGFTLPLFLTLTILQNMTIPSFSMLLFCLPILTFVLSASIGYARLFPSDLLAGTLTIVGLVLYEARHR
jgi:drug/metabolite transporter (DMT)-like permease